MSGKSTKISGYSRKARLTPELLLVFGIAALLPVGLLATGSAGSHLVQIGRFSTTLRSRSPAQIHNISLAARAVDGTVLSPGECFSFDRLVGATSEARGYQRAPALFNGALTQLYGGGVCQVSSTLYNAALRANLRIDERARHYWPVASVPPGLDAAFAHKQCDLRFTNTLSAPITIRVRVVADRLVASVLSPTALSGSVEIVREVSTTGQPTRVLRQAEDGCSPPRLVNPGWTGQKVRVYRIVRDGSGLERRELISVDDYPSMNRVETVAAGQA